MKLGEAVHVITFSPNDGDDVVFGYKSGDSISLLGGAEVDTLSYNIGADIVLKFQKSGADVGSIKLKGAKYHKISVFSDNKHSEDVYNVAYPEGMTANSEGTVVTVGSFEGTFDLNNYVNVKTVDASDSDSTILLIANHRGNRFRAGTGGATMIGGTAADYFYGSSGTDEYIYKKDTLGGYNLTTTVGGIKETIRAGMSTVGGYDVFYNYESGQDDIIFSDVTTDRVSVIGSDVVFYFEGANSSKTEGSLRVKKAKDKPITITDASGVTKTYTFTTSSTCPGGLNLNFNSAAFEERFYLEQIDNGNDYLIFKNNSLEEILINDKGIAGEKINGEQSLRILGSAYERQINNDFSIDEHGSSLRPYNYD